MSKNLFLFGLLIFSLTSCKKDIDYRVITSDLIAFTFRAGENQSQITKDLNCSILDSLVTGITGSATERSSLVANFTTTGATVTVNNIVQVSGVTKNDFTKPVVYTVTSPDGRQKSYTVKLESFTGIPVIYLTTESPVVSKDDYVKGTMKIDGNQNFNEGLYDGSITIKGRGNSTWYEPKKPYKIKFDKKTSLLGMPADKEWALLANYNDKSLIRNDVAFELSERVGLAWTPRRRFVELFMNGAYDGNYLLTETVEVAPSRLNITGMNSNNPIDTTGGFLVENDDRKDGAFWFYTPKNLPFVLKTPDVVSTLQYNYVKDYMSGIEDILYNRTYSDPVFQENIDADSFINWFIVNELMRNRDAIMFSSVFFYKDKGSKLRMGPVWDFDISSGDYTDNVAEGWYVRDASWIGWPFDNDIAYRQKVKERWNSLKTEKIASILLYIDSVANNLQYSQVENFKRWDIMNVSLFDGSIITGSYANEVTGLKSFLDKRIKWMDEEINKW